MAFMQENDASFISIHALHEESDTPVVFWATYPIGFQSTLSMRRATFFGAIVIEHRLISIHALHEESDFPFDGF